MHYEVIYECRPISVVITVNGLMSITILKKLQWLDKTLPGVVSCMYKENLNASISV